MKIQQVLKDGIVIQFAEDELLILNNALNEVCNGLDLWEFATRMGASREKVLALLQQISQSLASVEAKR